MPAPDQDEQPDSTALTGSVPKSQIEAVASDSDLAMDIDMRHGAEERFRALADLSPDILSIFDSEGRLVFNSAAAWRTHGYHAAELIGRTTFDLIHPDDSAQVQLAFARLLSKEVDPAIVRYRYRNSDGSYTWMEALARNELANPHLRGIIAVSRDISERKRAEEDRIVLSKLESTGELAGGIAHDFNNLLQVMLLNIGMARTDARAGRETEQYLSATHNAVVAAQHLTKQLITFAKGGAPICRPVCLKEVIHSSVTLALSGSNVLQDVVVDKDLFWTEADEGQIGQVIRNLILNARDAMADGGVVSIRAKNVMAPLQECPSIQPGAYVQVSISDTGHGIPVEVLPKIFDPYFSTKSKGPKKGIGLGLAICHTIIQKHNGVITVKSKPGEGTTFQFYLPACQKTGSPDREKQIREPIQRAAKSGKVLVMDDDDYMRLAMSSAIESRGFKTESAGNGSEAIDLYTRAMNQGSPFDVVILDLTIRGGMGGKETVLKLLAIDPKVKAVVISGYSDDPVLTNPERFGFKAGMEKAFDVDRLCSTISNIMEGNG